MACARDDAEIESRQTALDKKKHAVGERYVVRFLEDDAYMIADRNLITDCEVEVLVGKQLEVLYDKIKNKAADAVVLFAGDAERAAFLESKLSVSGREGEQQVLENFEREFTAGNTTTISKQKRVRAASTKRKPAHKTSCTKTVPPAVEEDAHEFHLSTGLPPDESTAADSGNEIAGAAERTGGQQINDYEWENSMSNHVAPCAPGAPSNSCATGLFCDDIADNATAEMEPRNASTVTQTYTRVYVHTYIHVYICMYIRMYLHMYIHGISMIGICEVPSIAVITSYVNRVWPATARRCV